jgi:putative alpha-1,2-mannosidase
LKFQNPLALIVSSFLFTFGCGGPDLHNGKNSKLTEFVDPFIGTDYHGHTFPVATVTFSMVQLSPDTRTLGWDACAGYHYSDSSILGFSHTHLSGTGIGDYGDILFMPFIGEVPLDPGEADQIDSGYRSRFNRETENARPGYYNVELTDYNINVELTATCRSGMQSVMARDCKRRILFG